MAKFLLFVFFFLTISQAKAQELTITSPDGDLSLRFELLAGIPSYSVDLKDVQMLKDSPLGLLTSAGDFSQDLHFLKSENDTIQKEYTQEKIKQSNIQYEANELRITLANQENNKIEIIFRVSNHNIGLRYQLFQYGEIASCTILNELTGFHFSEETTTFLSPQATPGIGWKASKPSYEEEYVADEAIGTDSKYGEGYTFPSLFRIANDGWVLISETGVDGSYCGSRLTNEQKNGLYSISFPNLEENNGIGSANPSIALPGYTPWRTITVDQSLQSIVETTIPFDLVDPLYEASQDYTYGRSTWSWIMWQDTSMNYNDQITYIDLAADMGYEYILIDAMWDANVGYESTAELIKYAQSNHVDVFLWYNSNGYWNNAPQGPKHKMNHNIVRKKEMKWLREMGVKGIKVDFFGGDKQETIQLYESILSDANDNGLMVIFHGCTLPRGWERMYPNFVGSEAVLASENLIFTQHANDMEAFNACLHPFIRNAVGSMEFGPVLLNKRHNRTNDGGTQRLTSDIFQLATAVLFQNAVQMFALAPNNLNEVPAFEIDFMKSIPTTWDETVFIDGYPGKYVVLARRHENKWYIAGVNAEKEAKNLTLKLPMLAGKEVTIFSDNQSLEASVEKLKIGESGTIELTIQPNGGIVVFD